MVQKYRHILSLSGGKDSAALAVYLSNREQWREILGVIGKFPIEQVEFEYVFMDTGKELPETYEYLDKLEAYIGKPLIRLSAYQDFDFYLRGEYFSLLPSPQARWCTRIMKLKPFEEHCGTDHIMSYIGIRADENREGYISHKSNIIPVYPFKEDGLVRADIFRILDEAGLGLPSYYDRITLSTNSAKIEVGRTRSGCTFCFFQQKIEWVWLLEKHPEAFEEASEIERLKKNGYTWSDGESLEELRARREQIIQEYLVQRERNAQRNKANSRLIDLFGEGDGEEEEEERGCAICHL